MNTFFNGLVALVFSIVPALGPSVVTIHNDDGGVVSEYNERWRQYAYSGTQVRISGSCTSACARFMTLPRVCALPNAEFFFHGMLVGGDLDIARGRADSRRWETHKAFAFQEKYRAFEFDKVEQRPALQVRLERGVRVIYPSIWSNAPNDPPFQKFLGVKASLLIPPCE